MVTKILSQEDPEDNEDNEDNEQGPQDPKKIPTPAGETPESNALDELRQSLLDSDAKKLPEDEPESIPQSSENKIAEDEIVSPNSQPDWLNQVDLIQTTDKGNSNIFLPEEDEIGEPVEISGEEQAFPNQELSREQVTTDSTDDDLTRRINSLRSETSQNFVGPSEVTPPFVVDELFEINKNNDKLSEKIRNGLVPPETIGQIINPSATEAEAIFFAKELGIDWSLIPKETREEKTQYLIDYFKNKYNNQSENNNPNISHPQISARKTENDWEESDSRLLALKETLIVPKAPEVKQQRTSFFTQLYIDFEQSSRFVKGLTLSLSVLVIVIILAIVYDVFIFPKVTPVQATPYTSELPFPKSIQLSGGWELPLNVGSIQNGNWNPTGAEWLKDTDICRMVSLPWNKQLDAVFKTFTAGDELMLGMSNSDQLFYKIESTKSLQLNEVNQLMNRNSPCLVVILTKEGTNVRQVAIGVPDYVKNAAQSTQITPTP